MASTDPALFRSAVAPYAGSFTSSGSAFTATPVPHTISTALCANTMVELSASNSTNMYATTRQFNFQQNLPEGTMVTAGCQVSPITVTGGTYLSIVDYFGIWWNTNTYWKDNSQGQIQTYVPEQIYVELLTDDMFTRQQGKIRQFMGNLSNAVRSTLAAAGFYM